MVCGSRIGRSHVVGDIMEKLHDQMENPTSARQNCVSHQRRHSKSFLIFLNNVCITARELHNSTLIDTGTPDARCLTFNEYSDAGVGIGVRWLDLVKGVRNAGWT